MTTGNSTGGAALGNGPVFKTGIMVILILFIFFYWAPGNKTVGMRNFTDVPTRTLPPLAQQSLTISPVVNPKELLVTAAGATLTKEVSAEDAAAQSTRPSSSSASTGVWLRGNFARFANNATTEEFMKDDNGGDGSRAIQCKSYPVLSAFGVSCPPRKKVVGSPVEGDAADAPAPQIATFALQHRQLEVVRVMGSFAGDAGENQFTQSNTMDLKGGALPKPSPAKSSKFTQAFPFTVKRSVIKSESSSAKEEYDTIVVTLPAPTKQQEKELIRGKDRRVTYFFDIEVKDPKNVLKNASTCFISIGDWGNPKPCQEEVATMMEQVAVDNWARFILSTGDNFYPMGVKSVNDPQFVTKWENVYNNKAGLRDLQWVLCAGNHDQWGIKGELQYGSKNPQWWFPNRVFTKTVPVGVKSTAKMVILDTYNRRNWNQQAMFLEKELNASSSLKEWKLVVNHEPVYCGSNHGLGPDNKKMKKVWKPILDGGVANAYFNGDDHTLQISRSENTDYFVSGGGGGSTGYTAKRLPENTWFSPTPLFGIMLHCITDSWGIESGGEESIMTTKLFDMNGTMVHTHYTVRT